jgi:tetratricopeptide (TPR) repeat protein
MNRIARIVFRPALPLLLLALSLVETASYAQEPAHPPSQMNIWQARRAMATELGVTDIRFSPDGFEYDVSYKSKGQTLSETTKIDLVTAPAVEANRNFVHAWSLKLTYDAGSLPKNKVTGHFLYRSWSDPPPSVCLFCDPPPITCSADCVQKAQTFAAAFNALRAFARDPNAPLRTFTQRAAAWRALATKPPIPDEVRVQRMMAEDAFKANKPDEALHYYEAGVLLYPTWPEGNFNAALIAGDLGYYAAAIEHMQAYLELVPEAADAQAARDKILIWQTKAKEK